MTPELVHLRDEPLLAFVAEHRPHYDRKNGDEPMQARRLILFPMLWECRCTCGCFWLGRQQDRDGCTLGPPPKES